MLLTLIPLLAVLGYSAFQDFRHGEVPNKVWLYAPVGLLFTLVELAFNPLYARVALVVMVLGVMIPFLLFYAFPQWFGGADAKALITIALSAPLTPSLVNAYPFLTLAFAGYLAIAYGFVFRRRSVKFLPFVFVGALISVFF